MVGRGGGSHRVWRSRSRAGIEGALYARCRRGCAGGMSGGGCGWEIGTDGGWVGEVEGGTRGGAFFSPGARRVEERIFYWSWVVDGWSWLEFREVPGTRLASQGAALSR